MSRKVIVSNTTAVEVKVGVKFPLIVSMTDRPEHEGRLKILLQELAFLVEGKMKQNLLFFPRV